jgi:hypothetical protein
MIVGFGGSSPTCHWHVTAWPWGSGGIRVGFAARLHIRSIWAGYVRCAAVGGGLRSSEASNHSNIGGGNPQ